MARARRIRVTGAEATYLAWELCGKPGHCGYQILLRFSGEAPDLPRLRGMVGARWGEIARMSFRLHEPGGLLPHRFRPRIYWTEDGFDPGTQVTGHRVPAGKTMREFVSELLADPAPVAVMGWRLRLVEGYSDEEFALLLQVHHGICDGVGALLLIRRLLEPGLGGADGARRAVRAIGQVSVAAPRLRRTLWPTLRTALPGSGRLPIGIVRTAERSLDWVEVPREAISAARKTALPGLTPTANDFYLAVVAGALRSTLLRQGRSLPRRLYAFVPVNLRGPGEADTVGNFVSHMRIPLPVQVASQPGRLAEVCRATRDEKAARYAATLNLLTPVIGRFPPAVVASAVTPITVPRYTGVICTAMPPLDTPLALAGRALLAGAGGPALVAGYGLGFALSRVRGRYTISITVGQANQDFGGLVRESLMEELDSYATAETGGQA